jgi:chromosome segregation ATPase
MLTTIKTMLSKKAEQTSTPFFLFCGLLFLLLSVWLTLFSHQSYIYCLSILIGFGLIWRCRFKGLLASYVLFSIVAFVQHTFVYSEHLWHLGLEASIFFGLGVSWLSLEELTREITQHVTQKQDLQKSLDEQKIHFIDERKGFENHIQEIHQKLQQQQRYHQELKQYQKASRQQVQYLNQSHDALLQKISQKSNELAKIQCAYEDLSKSTEHLHDQEALHKENQKLLQQLNHVRVEKHQIHLINETMADLLSKESKKNKIIEQARENNTQEQQQLQKKLSHAQEEIQTLYRQTQDLSQKMTAHQNMHQSVLQEKEQLLADQKKINRDLEQQLTEYQQQKESQKFDYATVTEQPEELSQEQQQLQKKLSQAQEEIQTLYQQTQDLSQKMTDHKNMHQSVLQEKEQLLAKEKKINRDLEQQLREYQQQKDQETQSKKPQRRDQQQNSHAIEQLEEELQQMRKTASAFSQLRKQFEEKSQVLQNTRSELFKLQNQLISAESDTQTLKSAWDPMLDKAYEEAALIEKELIDLQKENEQLCELIQRLQK